MGERIARARDRTHVCLQLVSLQPADAAVAISTDWYKSLATELCRPLTQPPTLAEYVDRSANALGN